MLNMQNDVERVARLTATEIITISIDIGQRLLESGAEIYRVEESIARICRAYGAKDIQVYAVPTAIIASMVPAEGNPITSVTRIYHRSTNLGRLDQLNVLCRSLCKEPMDYESIQEQLHLIDQHANFRAAELCLATGGSGLFFTLLFGGSLAEALCACCTCLVLWGLITSMNRIHVNGLFLNVAGGFWVALSGLLCYRFGWVGQYDTMIVGSIMALVPGLPMTNAIRDLIAGDIVAGITKFTEALLVAAGIAVGAAMPLSLAGMLGG